MTAWWWILASVACLVVAHFWVPAYAGTVVFALIALGEFETRPRRRRWKDSHRV